jgi:EmrB/QacA subfamily drug resistance transporter
MSSDRSRHAALYVLCAGMLMIVLDMTVVNVALPSIQRSLGFTTTGLAWVVNAYLIAFGGLLLLAGRLGDLFGRRRVFLIGLAIFIAASLVCGLAQSRLILTTARFVQGAGGALTSAVILGLIVTMFPEPKEQAKALGVFAFVASSGGAVGLLVGGVVTQAVDWHWIFFINAPIGVATAALALYLVPRDTLSRGDDGGPVDVSRVDVVRVDVIGAVLVTAALMLAVYTVVTPAAEHGWAAASTLECGAGAVALLAAFVWRQATVAYPLLPLRVFTSSRLVLGNVVQILGAAAMFATFFLGSLDAREVLGYGPVEIGMAFLPLPVLMAVLSVRFSEPLVTRHGAKPLVVSGMLVISLGLLWLVRVPVAAGYWTDLFPAFALMGAGAGLCFPPLMGLAMSGADPHDAGLASGLVNTSGQVGGALGLAVIATLAAARTGSLDGSDPVARRVALTSGYHVGYLVAVLCALAGAAVALSIRAARSPAGEPVSGVTQQTDPAPHLPTQQTALADAAP